MPKPESHLPLKPVVFGAQRQVDVPIVLHARVGMGFHGDGESFGQTRFHIVDQPLHESWHFVMAIPETRVPTADARRILPPTLPHAVAPRTVSRLVGLLHTLASGDEDRLASFLFDEVHVPFRRRLAPGMEDAMAAGRQAGAAGVTISGHGPGLVALTTAGDAAKAIADAMAGAFRSAGQLADTACLRPFRTGALPSN